MACLSDASLGWGRFCVAKPSYYGGEKKCYKTGQRCAGAPGKPYVDYHPCCKPSDSCAEDADMGWGSFCKPSGGYYSAPGDKCYKTGARCMGAPGKPYVTYMPCCESGDECVKDSYMGWGYFCKGSTSYPETPKSYYKPPTVTDAPPAPKSYGYGYGYGYDKKKKEPKCLVDVPLATDAVDSLVPEPTELFYEVVIAYEDDVCEYGAENFPAAIVTDTLDTICTGLTALPATVGCYFEAISNTELTATGTQVVQVVRQGGSVVYYKLEFHVPFESQADAEAYFAVLELPGGVTVTVSVNAVAAPTSDPFGFN